MRGATDEERVFAGGVVQEALDRVVDLALALSVGCEDFISTQAQQQWDRTRDVTTREATTVRNGQRLLFTVVPTNDALGSMVRV